MEKWKENKWIKKIGLNRLALCGVLVLLYAVFAVLSPDFLNYSRILSALNYAYFLGFLAFGVTFVIATGGIDFSIGPVMFAASLISGQLLVKSGWPLLLCLIVSVMVGAAFGSINGFFVAYCGLPSFITSLAGMQLAKGIGSVFTRTQSVSWPQGTEAAGWYRNLIKIQVGGVQIPTGLIILVAAGVVLSAVLTKTKFGRYILCIGSNKEAVRLSGVNVKKWEMLAYIVCGICAGIAAIFYVAAYTTVQPGLGDTFNNEAIASCVMGGTSMAGGLASISGSFIGVMIVSLLQEGILAMGFQKDYQYMITGLIVLLAVYADIRSRRKKK